MPGQSYATPTDDQMAWKEACPEPTKLPAHLVAFLQCGVEPIIGVRRRDGRPLIGAGVGCRLQDTSTVRLFVTVRENLDLLDAIEHGSRIAATFSRVRDNRSIQLKAPAGLIGDAQPDDLCEIARQVAIYSDELVELGFSRKQVDAFYLYDAKDLKVVSFQPEQVFTQTPGPGAGAELQR